MPSLEEDVVPAGALGPGFALLSQKVDLNIDFAGRRITGSTQLVAQPLTKDLKSFRLNCRQCRITRAVIEGKPAPVSYQDPYDKVRQRKGASNIHHYEYLKKKIAPHVKDLPDPELHLSLPPRVAIKELDVDNGYTTAAPLLKRKDSETGAPLDTPMIQETEGPRFAPLKIYFEFAVHDFRDGLHWVGMNDIDGRFPHVYTRSALFPGATSSIFPCVDSLNARCMWEISITCPRTLGDAFRKQPPLSATEAPERTNGDHAGSQAPKRSDEWSIVLNEEERALELNVICSGEMVDEVVDGSDGTTRTVSFVCAVPVAARHIAFAVGPFESIDLSAEFRQSDEDDKLGHSAVKVLGYCLPGRSEELRNTCLPISKAIDYFTVTYGTFPFPNYKLCFVDDLASDITDAAGLSICSNRLLFPENVIDTLDPHTRILVLALANQYCGVNIIAKDPSDLWAIVGTAGFIADMFMKKLAGNNEYRFRQKLAADKVFEHDVGRYSLQQLGGQLDIDPSEFTFMQLKASLVLFILDRRLAKQSGTSGMNRIITRIFLNAKTGELQNGELTTEYFAKTCEKLGHARLESFFKQWVVLAGCPDFMVTQKFNKKKLVVEMTIQQMQSMRPRSSKLTPSTFLREAKEEISEAYAPEVQVAFTGPMTIRIHEADGTPYEHIVEIKDVTTRFDIPYNTKYKRLKRSKRAKERSIAINGPEQVGDSQDDVLLYCLGDTLQTDQEVKEWYLSDWTEQQENQMGQESYEWIRMDADFEWIGRMNVNMPIYMFVSQLQQDRDVVAQYESIQRITQQEPHSLGSTILVRTLMDRRYFHGIRTAAAMGLVKLAVPAVKYVGLFHLDKAFSELYCFPDNPSMPRPNDFTDRASYLVQCTIPKAMVLVRDPEGRVPLQVRKFLSDKIKFNDNTHNETENISDCYYLATLMQCLTEAVASMTKPPKSYAFSFDDDDQVGDTQEDLFKTEALNELERYRNSDEWTPSFHNITTLTAIECLERVVSAGAVKHRSLDILTYCRRENADNVRVRAFRAIVNLKLTQKPAVLRYFLDTLSDDPSPFIRTQLLGIFGEALGIAAIGDNEETPSADVQMDIDSGLVLDQEVPTESRQLEIARKSSPEGALNALKKEVEKDELFKDTLWDAMLSQTLSLTETNSLLDIAGLLFEPSSAQGRLVLSLALPRKWSVKHVGFGKISFKRTANVQTKPSKYQPLSAKDHKLVKGHHLKYTGPLAVQETKPEKAEKPPLTEAELLAAKIAETQKLIEQQQRLQQRTSTGKSQMSPPPLPTPTEGGGGGFKLSLKRKQSVDSGRATSPKVLKTSKASTPTASTPSTPLNGTKPSNFKPSETIVVNTGPRQPPPVKAGTTKGGPPSKAKSRIVKLRLPTKPDQVSTILSLPPQSGDRGRSSTLSSTPAAPGVDGYFPSVSAPANGVPATTTTTPGKLSKPNWNVGGFRNFGSSSSPTGPQPPPPIKTEPEDLPVPSSPDDVPLAQQRRQLMAQTEPAGTESDGESGGNITLAPAPAPAAAAPKAASPAAPATPVSASSASGSAPKKFILKLGRRPSAQSPT